MLPDKIRLFNNHLFCFKHFLVNSYREQKFLFYYELSVSLQLNVKLFLNCVGLNNTNQMYHYS